MRVRYPSLKSVLLQTCAARSRAALTFVYIATLCHLTYPLPPQERDKYKTTCNSLTTELAKVRAELNEVKVKASQDQPANDKLVLVGRQTRIESLFNFQNLSL